MDFNDLMKIKTWSTLAIIATFGTVVNQFVLTIPAVSSGISSVGGMAGGMATYVVGFLSLLVVLAIAIPVAKAVGYGV